MSSQFLPVLLIFSALLTQIIGINDDVWASWWEVAPFAYEKVKFDHDAYHDAHDMTKEVNGILGTAVHMMVDACMPHKNLKFLQFQNEKEMFSHIGVDSNSTFAFPVVRSSLLRDIDRMLRNISFIPIVETPGPLILAGAVRSTGALSSLAGTWPLLILVLSTAAIAGVIIWACEHYWNEEEFPESFLQGFWEGIWWAFISMTTVGYGDRSPRSIPGRIFTFFWVILGLVIMSIFTATLATAFSSEHLDPNNIVGIPVGVMKGTEDYVAGFMFGAQIKEYDSIHDLLVALVETEEVHYVLVDTYNGFHSSVAFEEKGVIVQGIVNRPAVHGVSVYGQSDDVISCMTEEIAHKRYNIYEELENLLHVLAEEQGGKSSRTSSNIAGSTLIVTYISIGIWVFLFIVGLLIDYCYLRPKRQKVHEEKMAEENKLKTANGNNTFNTGISMVAKC